MKSHKKIKNVKNQGSRSCMCVRRGEGLPTLTERSDVIYAYKKKLLLINYTIIVRYYDINVIKNNLGRYEFQFKTYVWFSKYTMGIHHQ